MIPAAAHKIIKTGQQSAFPFPNKDVSLFFSGRKTIGSPPAPFLIYSNFLALTNITFVSIYTDYNFILRYSYSAILPISASHIHPVVAKLFLIPLYKSPNHQNSKLIQHPSARNDTHNPFHPPVPLYGTSPNCGNPNFSLRVPFPHHPHTPAPMIFSVRIICPIC